MGSTDEAIEAMLATLRETPRVMPGTLIYDGVVFELNDAGDGYEYDPEDPRAEGVVAALEGMKP